MISVTITRAEIDIHAVLAMIGIKNEDIEDEREYGNLMSMGGADLMKTVVSGLYVLVLESEKMLLVLFIVDLLKLSITLSSRMFYMSIIALFSVYLLHFLRLLLLLQSPWICRFNVLCS